MDVLRRRISYANVMATVALFVALGGSSYAAIKLSVNSVGNRELKQRAVTPAKLSPTTVAFVKQGGGTGHAAASSALDYRERQSTVQVGQEDGLVLKCPRARPHAISGYFGPTDKAGLGKLVLTDSTPVDSSNNAPRSWDIGVRNLDTQPRKWFGGVVCMR